MGEALALIDFGAGNLHSVASALAAAGADNVMVTADPGVVARAERIVLPGVGSFGACRDALVAIDGMIEELVDSVLVRGKPFLGICVGMQLLADSGTEFGTHSGLGWIGGEVREMDSRSGAIKVPHMGWNRVEPVGDHPLIVAGEAYFLHSFQFEPSDKGHLLGTTDHGGPVTAAIGRENIAGVQFHPEKSQRYGLDLLRRFLDWRP